MTPRRLTPDDVPACMRLKDAAGWNQTAQDWRNLMALEPAGCFGADLEGVLAATATALRYQNDLAWIGMVLTAPEFRRRGLARALMQAALEFLDCQGVRWSKLDATDMGAPLYRQLGFEDECRVERWCRPAAAEAWPASAWPGGFDPDLDAEAFGVDRTAVLWRVSCESAFIPGCGFAMGRPGTRADYFGPCVARSAEAARSLLEWFLARHPDREVFWDLLPGNAAAQALAEEFGFTRARRLVRMARPGAGRPEPLPHDDSLVFAIAGFEFG